MAVFWVLVVATAALLAALIAYAIWRARPAAVREDLQRRFGREYERAVEETGSGDAARRELRARIRRVGRMPLRSLDDRERAGYWVTLQGQRARFVDDPSSAVRECEALVQAVLRAEGYPPADFAQQLADLSVHHASIVEDYRRARALSRGGRADPDELRDAMRHYRIVLAELIERPARVYAPQATAAEESV